MALTTVDKTILGVLDRIAYQQAAASVACNGGTDVWQRIDDAGDETFENRVKGTNATALDVAFLSFPIGEWQAMRAFAADLAQYVTVDLGFTDFGGWLADRRVRIDQRVAAVLRAIWGPTIVPAANVHGPADAGSAAEGTALGSLTRGGSLSPGTDIDTTLAGPSAVLARVTAIGSADWTLSVTAKIDAETTKTLSSVVKGTGNGGAIGNTYVLGLQALSAGAAAGQKVVPVAATAQFEPGQTVLLTQWTGTPPAEDWAQQEIGIVASVQKNTSITLEADLLHSYTTSGWVRPCFIGLSDASGTGGTSGDRVSFYPAADRRLRL